MKNLLLLILCFVSLSNSYAEENTWQEHWISGLECLEQSQYDKAQKFFSVAVNRMSEAELEQNPSVLMNLAQVDFNLKNYDDSIKHCKFLLNLEIISDQEKLLLGSMIVSSLVQIGKEVEAQDAYMEYIAKSTLMLRHHFGKNKIIVSHIPDCENFKKSTKRLYVKKFCETEENLHDYGNIWVIDIKKKCECEFSEINVPLEAKSSRNPEAIRACCNTCSTLAVGAAAVCSYIPGCSVPTTVCKLSCVMFVEAARQACEWCCYNGGMGNKCWENFATWKDDFHDANPECPHP